MTLRELCEPFFLYVCRLNRSARKASRLDYRQTRAEIEALCNEMSATADADPGLSSQFGKVKLALVFFVDSIIAESGLSFAQQWNQKRLAYELDRLGWADQPEMAGDEKFYIILDETLADKGEAAVERLAILYTCLGLGFVGFYAGQPEHLRRKMGECAARLRKVMDANDTARICPEAYENVDARDFVTPPGAKLVGWTIALCASLLLVFTVAYAAYTSSSNKLKTKLEGIINYQPATTSGAAASTPPATPQAGMTEGRSDASPTLENTSSRPST